MKRFIVGFVVALALGGGGVLIAIGDRNQGEDNKRATAEAHSHGETIASVADLTATSDLAIRGVAESTSPGRRIEEEPGSFLEYERVTIRITSQYWSADGVAPGTIVLEQPVRDGGNPVVVDGMKPLTQGQEVVLFLKVVDPELNPDGDKTFVIRAGLGRFVVGADGSLVGPEVGSPVVDEIERMGLGELESEVEALVAQGLTPPADDDGTSVH